MHVSRHVPQVPVRARSFVALSAILALAVSLVLGLASCAPGSGVTGSAASAGSHASASAGADSSASAGSTSAPGQSPRPNAASASSSDTSSSPSASVQAVQPQASDFDYADYPSIVSHDYVPPDISVDEAGVYSSKDEVALYIHEFGHLPSNYLGKTKARKAGWVASEGNLWDVLPGKSIGGSEWYNDDGDLPAKEGRVYRECDIDYEGGYRNAQRIVFSNDGLVFYTGDHYNSFEQLY